MVVAVCESAVSHVCLEITVKAARVSLSSYGLIKL